MTSKYSIKLGRIHLLGQLGFFTNGLMSGMVLLLNLDPVSDLKVDKLTMAPTDNLRLPGSLQLEICKASTNQNLR